MFSKLFTTLFLFVTLQFYAKPLCMDPMPITNKGITPLFDEELHPTQPLIALLTLVGMQEPCTDLFTINEWAQKNLLRSGERWETQTNRFEALAAELKPLLIELGFIHEIFPSFTTYEGALVHGAPLDCTRKRLAYLIQQWNHGIRFKHLYLLSGERLLNPLYEHAEALLSDSSSRLKIRADFHPPAVLPQTESAMMLFVWNQAVLPQEMREELTVHLINSPMQQDPLSKTWIRPTTIDTIISWAQSTPPAGRYLAISNAPHILRQDLVTKVFSSKNCEIDTVGPQVRAQEKIIIILDEMARYIFHLAELAQQQAT